MEAVFIINTVSKTLSFQPRETLLQTLRKAGHTEVKSGCNQGECGMCTVLIGGSQVNSCQVLTATVMGAEITTVKALGDIRNPHPIQMAFQEAGGVQCGFCTPAKILATYALLQKHPEPSEEQIRFAFDGNICRCTGYVKIFEAVRLAVQKMKSAGVN
jgi:aerobic-type carbon monoxide dehydrogenase small subunit (CoxS/CutS family)